MAISPHAQALTQGSTAIGVGATAGEGTRAATAGSTVAGIKLFTWTPSTTSIEATSIGALSAATKAQTTAVGYKAQALAKNALVVGSSAIAEGENSIVLGTTSTTNTAAANSVAIGSDSDVSGEGSVAIGKNVDVVGARSVAIGGITSGNIQTRATVDEVVALGAGAQATLTKGVAIGSESVTTSALGKVGYVSGNSTIDTNNSTWTATHAAVAVGDNTSVNGYAKVTRQITGVAAGTEDTDAVNVAQLKRVTGGITFQGNTNNDTGADGSQQALGSTLTISGGATDASSSSNVKTVVTDNKVEIQLLDAPSFKGKVTAAGFDAGGGVANATNQITNVKSGVDGTTLAAATGSTLNNAANIGDLQNLSKAGLYFKGNGNTVSSGAHRDLGQTLELIGATSGTAPTAISTVAAVSGTYSAKNLQTYTDDSSGRVQIQLAENPEFTSVKIGDTTNNTTLTSTANGLDVGGDKITNVAAGTSSKDAVNVSQLTGVITALGGGAALNTDGTIKAPSYTITKTDGTTYTAANNVGDALNNLNSEVIKPITFTGDSGSSTQKLGSSFAIVAGNNTDTSTTNLKTAVTNGKVEISMANAPNFSGTVTAPKFITSGSNTITVDGVAGTIGGLTNKNFDPDNIVSGQAATEDQLQLVSAVAGKGWSLQVNGDTAEKVAPGDIVELLDGKNIKITRSGKDVTIATLDEVSFTKTTVGNVVIDAATNKITGLEAGALSSTSKDAVNGSQLYAVGSSTASALGGSSMFNPATGQVTASLSVGGNSYSSVQSALNALNSVSNKGWNLTANGANSSNVAPDATVDLNNSDGNIAITKTANNVTFNLAKDLKVDSLTAGDTVVNSSGLTISGGPSVTKSGIDARDTKITNVADGTVAAGSKDAVNGSQLYAVQSSIQNTVNNATFGITAQDGNSVTKSLNNTISVVGGASDSASASSSNIKTVVKDGKIEIQIVDAPTFNGQITANGGVTVKDHFTVGAGTTVDMGGNKVTNVAAGTATTDAVNVGQLNSAISSALGGNTTTPGGTVTLPSGQTTTVSDALKTYDVSGQTATNNNTVLSAIKNMNEGGIKYFHTNDDSGQIVGGAVANTNDSSASGKYATAIGYQATASAQNAVALGAGSQALAQNTIAIGTGNIVSGQNSGAIGDPNNVSGSGSYVYGNNNIAADNSFVIGNNVTVAKDLTGSVVLGNNSTVEKAHVGTYTIGGYADAQVAGSKGTSTQVVSVGSAGSERQIQNVAPGVVSATSTDAINGSQLYAVGQMLGDTAAKIGGVAKDANAGTASAIAAANLPQSTIPGMGMTTVGLGTYDGQSALAVGISKMSDSGKWVIKASATTNTQGKVGAGVGVGFHW